MAVAGKPLTSKFPAATPNTGFENVTVICVSVPDVDPGAGLTAKIVGGLVSGGIGGAGLFVMAIPLPEKRTTRDPPFALVVCRYQKLKV